MKSTTTSITNHSTSCITCKSTSGIPKIILRPFFQQLCVEGAWTVIRIHFIELSPAEFRSFVVRTSYQVGNLISSASSTIEATVR
ncbi:unnamed protein product [Rotaria sordida]|uniref:Uncharacterized protein n=2 Tax=Rotaria sordida TaxID=392033 RepID=A0A819L6P8_9BILA|nr:unnamed protein product [Rotaria sordida]CAF1358212.1 unnamed protein product [Rotaria sordida]CAF1388727.1 unnamed protein product [Rotaria sordida]CAF3614358.1 unnamed protein product [Rotaria sordida]CAF3931756.1 unnamed protein product [Rotaria sordida]